MFKLNYIIIPGIAVAISSLGSFLSRDGMGWYRTINLPALTPPSWVFGVAWTIIYALTSLAVIYVWNTYPRNNLFYVIMILFVVNAAANLAWSYIFFNKHLIGLALVDSIVLLLTCFGLIVLTGWVAWVPAFLLMPYLAWLTFATYLGSRILQLN